MREKVENEIKKLVDEGILEPIENSDWSTPIVPVLKSDGRIRICGDYKVSINPYLEIDKYPIPRISDLLTKIVGGTLFTKLDLSQAFQQVVLDENSQKLTTLSTHLGLFKTTRLMFAVASAPGLFKREIEKVIEGIDGTVAFFDDILIMGKNKVEHDTRLREVFSHFMRFGLTLRKDKCKFARDLVSYLGFIIDKEGVRADDNKIHAIVNVQAPSNITELKSLNLF